MPSIRDGLTVGQGCSLLRGTGSTLVCLAALAEVEAFFRTQLGLEESEGWAARSVGLEPLFEGDGATEEPDGD